MDKIEKFLRKLDAKHRQQLIGSMEAIAQNRLERFDVKPLAGRKGWWRCRVGNIRIVFIHTSAGHNIIYTVDYRGNVYKKRA